MHPQLVDGHLRTLKRRISAQPLHALPTLLLCTRPSSPRQSPDDVLPMYLAGYSRAYWWWFRDGDIFPSPNCHQMKMVAHNEPVAGACLRLSVGRLDMKYGGRSAQRHLNSLFGLISKYKSFLFSHSRASYVALIFAPTLPNLFPSLSLLFCVHHGTYISKRHHR